MGEFDNTWPKSVRLNKENREKFVKAALGNIMPAEKEPTLANFTQTWGPIVYKAIYDPLEAHMDALPKWFFTEATEFHVDLFKYESKTSPWKDKDGLIEFDLPSKERMIVEENVYSWNRSTQECIAQIPEGHDVIQEYKDHCQASDDWHTQHKELKDTLVSVSDACNTSHQLFRAWPKAVQFAEECFPYVEPAEAKRGGQTDISTEQLELTAKIAQATAGAQVNN